MLFRIILCSALTIIQALRRSFYILKLCICKININTLNLARLDPAVLILISYQAAIGSILILFIQIETDKVFMTSQISFTGC